MLDKAYDPKPVEAARLKAWDEADLFRRAASTGKGNPFTIVIPPPNVTGALHLGHALNNALQDVLIRWNRLLGRPVCWVPGTDHGGIATQNVMEKQLKADGKSRHDLGRDKFQERMQEWTRDCKKTILGQLKRLGCALDWEREAFTMDEARAHAVHECFKRLWDKGWIYRGERLVNWCVRCGTALSDIEVEREERKGKLTHIHYPLEDGTEGVVVATTRPETMFGDTAVAVHPDDARWSRLIGKHVRLPLTDRRIPVIGDSSVESAFGTGALKITPAHDQADWEIGERHKLPAVKAIGPDGKLTAAAGPYQGLSRDKARDQVPLDLETQGFLRKTEDHKSAVGVCYRCGQVIEPLLSLQWFVKQGELAKEALKALDDGRFAIHPASWAKPYRDWLANIRDWCVSRQIWWGHRIPVWYKEGEKPRFAVAAPGAGWTQDPDVLDTWFSSALWPLSVFGWPDKTADLKRFYPTSVLVTGYEILYLWVARMQMTGLEFEGKVPFPDAVIHGIVRDKSGKKMSKSLGNVIDPLVMMDKYGTDALRFSLLRQAHPGRDIPFAEESLTGARNFVNKLWNSTRFVLMNLPENASKPYGLEALSHCCLELADKWILSEYQKTLAEAKSLMSRFETAAAADLLYGFLWDKFCDWYVELAKTRLQGIDGEEKEAARAILVHVLSGTLKALHPFMPFATEELWLALKPFSGAKEAFILDAGLEEPGFDWGNPEAERDMAVVMEAIAAIRSTRSQLNVPPGLKIAALASGGSPEARALLQKHESYLTNLARLEKVTPAANGAPPPQSATAVAAGIKFFIPLAGLIDFDKERERLKKELAKTEAEAAKIAQKSENKSFLERAPKEEVELARAQHAAALARKAQLEETLKALS